MAVKTYKSWIYTADDATEYAVRVADYISSQVDGSSNPKIGGTQAPPGLPVRPKTLKMRHVLVASVTNGVYRKVPVMAIDADLWVTAASTIQLNLGQPTVLTTFTRYGLEGERTRHERKTT